MAEKESAYDFVGRPKVADKSFGKKGGEVGGSTKKAMEKEGSTEGVGGGLRAEAMKEEPILHESTFRSGPKDKNWEKKPETGTPRQEASFRNRDRQGTGIEHEPVYQGKFPSYPTKGPKGMKPSEQEDD